MGCHMSLGGYHMGTAPVHSTVAPAGSPYSTLPVWPLCPLSWGWARGVLNGEKRKNMLVPYKKTKTYGLPSGERRAFVKLSPYA